MRGKRCHTRPCEVLRCSPRVVVGMDRLQPQWWSLQPPNNAVVAYGTTGRAPPSLVWSYRYRLLVLTRAWQALPYAAVRGTALFTTRGGGYGATTPAVMAAVASTPRHGCVRDAARSPLTLVSSVSNVRSTLVSRRTTHSANTWASPPQMQGQTRRPTAHFVLSSRHAHGHQIRDSVTIRDYP